MKTLIKTTALALTLLTSSSVFAKAEKFEIDPTHSFVQFKASHMGFSWLLGRFNDVEGVLMFDDQDISKSSIKVTINTASLDSNHAKRNKHLTSDDYIDAGKYPKATFNSTAVSQQGEDILITGDFMFHGITKSMTIVAQEVGAGKDPWGGFRRGYEGKLAFDKTDFGMKGKPGSASNSIQLSLFIEAIKAK